MMLVQLFVSLEAENYFSWMHGNTEQRFNLTLYLANIVQYRYNHVEPVYEKRLFHKRQIIAAILHMR